MEKTQWEVIVIGAGFVGNFTAKILASRGLNVLVIEEHEQIGTPRHCAGLISISGMQRLHLTEIAQKHEVIYNTVRHAIFTGIRGVKRVLTGRRPTAQVVNRAKLDKVMYQQAQHAGATYRLGSRVRMLERNGNVHVTFTDGKETVLTGDVVVDAEGARRTLIQSFPGVDLSHRLPGLQMDIKTKATVVPRNAVELVFNLPDFFSWIIPLTPRVYRFGLATRKWGNHLRPLLMKLISDRTPRFEPVRQFGGLVLTGGPIERFVWGRVIAVGDAAGWVKPTTGGGVVFGGLTAKLAAKAIEEAIRHQRPLTQFKKVTKRYRREFKMMQFARDTLDVLGPYGIERVLKLLPQPMFTKLKGDYDLQFKTILKLLFPPLLLF
ncbi:MAG: NAD(P)/FAD-dependent oxidoreductase [Candidatus Korarchaeota archaeon]|nr:NAD(P)/FAD-dependent oxidoreductase [Candidatus Korarchaeota archaeon]NIU83072.1 geranylgeranyl reductase family protein [Candidatus Thorarchaeota archaeon]NIW12616.1 geranylgeranyl reductase family protein [Candidatus Thorarchaeota archaeon]NIW50827.1 geranylgeranyl reductase family protein [Candidatus Korarchaeota archaeon]